MYLACTVTNIVLQCGFFFNYMHILDSGTIIAFTNKREICQIIEGRDKGKFIVSHQCRIDRGEVWACSCPEPPGQSEAIKEGE